MLQKESQVPDPEALSVTETEKKGQVTKAPTTSTPTKNNTMTNNNDANTKTTPAKSAAFEWEEVKKARNRINSQRIRERERAQIANLEAERARLWLSNDAIQFQNRHFREIIAQILEVREMKRTRAMAGGAMGIGGTPAPGTSAALAALGGGSSMQMPLGMGGLGGGLAKSLSGLSDADLLARHQATTLEMQNMMRQQDAMDRFGAGGGAGMGGLNMGLNNGMNMNMNMNGINMNGINMNATSASPYADMAENLRIRQLMLQQSTASGIGDFEPRGLLSSIGGGASNLLGNNGGGDILTGNANSNGLSLGAGAMGDLGGSIGDADILQMSKRQKLGM